MRHPQFAANKSMPVFSGVAAALPSPNPHLNITRIFRSATGRAFYRIAIFFTAMAACLFYVSFSYAAEANPESPAKIDMQVPFAKIGVVDMQVVATQSEPAKAAKKQLEAKYGKEREELEKEGNSLKKQAESLKNPKITEEKQRAFIKAKQKLDNDTRNFLRKVEQDEVKLRQDMVTLIFSAAYEVAKAKGFNFIVDITAGGVLYADKSMELTNDVLEEVNKIFKEKKANPDKGDTKSDEQPAKK